MVVVFGLWLADFIVNDVFKVIDNRLPLFMAILITYILSTYLIIPTSIHLIRVFQKTKHIPRYAVTRDGFISDPVNIAFVGTKRQIEITMKKAGWDGADKITVGSIWKVIKSTVFGTTYKTAPFVNLFLFGRKQDLAFQKHPEGTTHERHHVRLWAVKTKRPDARLDAIIKYWQDIISVDGNKKHLWVAAGTKESGLSIARISGQLIHSMDPDTNAERDYIANDMKKTGRTTEIQHIDVGESYSGNAIAIGSNVEADGDLKVVVLK